MKTPILCSIALLSFALGALDQAVSSTPSIVRSSEDNQPVRVHLVLESVREPVPALRYPLRYGVIDQEPGNAALAYNMALIQLMDAGGDGEDMDQMREWLDAPLGALPTADAREAVNRFDMALETVSRAARYQHCDWQLLIKEKGYALLLPHLGGLRDLGRILALRSRLHLIDGDFSGALADIRTGLTLAQHIGNSATLIEGLVGIACAGIMLDRVEEWMGSPGSPSLYWALTELSAKPMFSFYDAMRWERSVLYVHAPVLKDLDHQTITVEQYHEALGELLNLAGPASPVERPAVVGTGVALAVYPRACAALRANGLTEEEVHALPVAQVVTRYLLGQFEHHRDNAFKWAAVPYPQARAGMRAAGEALNQAMEEDPVGSFLPGILLPAVIQASTRFAELDRRLAALQGIAALRLHLVVNAGDFPDSLDQVTDFPVPDDPMTGRPFAYEAGPEGARLELPALSGDHSRHGRIYKLTLTN